MFISLYFLLTQLGIVLHFYSPGPIKTVTIPTAQNDLGMLMSMLFMGLANLSAKKNRPLSSLAMLVKGEAMREINQKMNDTEMARHPRTLSSIVYLSSGIRVCVHVSESYLKYQLLIPLVDLPCYCGCS